MLAPKTARAAKSIVTISTRWRFAVGVGNALLFVLLLLSGFILVIFLSRPVALMVQVHTGCGFAYWLSGSGLLAIKLTTGNGRHYRVEATGLVTRCIRARRVLPFWHYEERIRSRQQAE